MTAHWIYRTGFDGYCSKCGALVLLDLSFHMIDPCKHLVKTYGTGPVL